MEAQLEKTPFIAGETFSLADIALYAYTHSAGSKGGFEMARFRGSNAWLARCADDPGHVAIEMGMRFETKKRSQSPAFPINGYCRNQAAESWSAEDLPVRRSWVISYLTSGLRSDRSCLNVQQRRCGRKMSGPPASAG